MASLSTESSLVQRFQLPGAPTLEASVSDTAPIVFSRMRTERALPGRSLSPRPDSAFTFQLPLIPAAFTDLRFGDRVVALPEIQEPGRAFLFDLSARPTVGLGTAFDNVRCYISQQTIDDLAYARGLRRVGGLTQRSFGERDPILFHLAKLLVPALESSHPVSSAFLEYIALAFHEHVITTYGSACTSEPRRSGGLAPWQIRRTVDFIEAHLDKNPSISEMARACEVSASHFAEAFRHTMHMPPHQWLIRRRIERARTLLQGTQMTLAAIAIACGFCDQSHFSRLFVRLVGSSPAQWRRLHRSG